MADGALEKLFFQISLIDKITGPSRGVCSAVARMQRQFGDAAVQLSFGSAAIGGVINRMNAFVAPARDMNKALNEVASLGVAPAELAKLEAASKKITSRFGGDAAEMVRSAYDIQSAIPGLADGALAAFTSTSAVLAKATKSSKKEMTDYMGSMYNIFETDAKKIGQAEWVEQLAGKTAYAVQMFKTTGPEMKQAFEGIGSTAQLMGVKMEEQIAVLGTLQGSMGAANAGTAYKGLMTHLDSGQKTLGVNFKDANGNLLPIYDILGKIQGKIGGLDKDQRVAMLTKAFGETGAQAVMNLMEKTGQLKTSITDLSAIQGSELALKMAEQMIDPAERLDGVLNVLKTTLGQALLPAVNMVIGGLARMGIWLNWAVENIPGMNVVVGVLVGSVAALVLAFGALKVITGVRGMLKTLHTSFRVLRVVIHKSHLAARIFNLTNLKMTAGMIWQKTVMIASKIAMLIYAGAMWVLNGGLITAAIGVWSFTAALLACPITWIVIGIVALIAAVALLVVYWDEICAWFKKSWEYLLLLIGPIGWVIFAFRKWGVIKDIAGAVWRGIVAGFQWMWERLKMVGTAIGDFFVGIWDMIVEVFQSMINAVMGVIQGVVNGVLAIYNKITGKNVQVNWSIDYKKNQPAVSGAAGSSSRDIAAGGVRGGTTTNRTTNYGGVTVNAPNGLGPGQLEEYMALQG
ncbi:MAG: phage tail tape measure protein [Victivallaceae bacterium]|nr:phage tail tape measure protein [Victivallaceae bacterium]